MTASSFTEKQLRVTFTLSNNAVFEGTNSSTLILSGLRIVTNIRGAGMPAFPDADVEVFGMAQADMNALSALTFQTLGVNRNNVQIEANSGNGWTTVFNGQIITASIDYMPAPEVGLRVHARVLGFEQINPAQPTSYTGATDVATIVSNLASQMGKAFENNNVTATLSNPYYSGTLADQLRAVKQASGIDIYNEPTLIAICNNGEPRAVPGFTLSPSSGLVGYPVVDSRGYINVRSLFNAAFRFGGPLTIQGSDVVIDPNQPATLNSRANGNWLIGTLSHTLESKKFGGAWFSDLLLYPPGSLPPLS